MRITTFGSNRLHSNFSSPPLARHQKSASTTRYRWPTPNKTTKLHLNNVAILKLSTSHQEEEK